MTMIVVEELTTITTEIQTRQLVGGTTVITLLLSAEDWWTDGQQIIITWRFGEIISEAISLFVLFDKSRCQGCISLISLTLHKQK